MRLMALLLCFAFIACGHGKKDKNSHVSFLPENTLFTADDPSLTVNANGIDEAYFNAIIAKAQAIYAPIVAQHGGTLEISGDWSDSTVNAYADRQGSSWLVHMYGGMARRSEITKSKGCQSLCVGPVTHCFKPLDEQNLYSDLHIDSGRIAQPSRVMHVHISDHYTCDVVNGQTSLLCLASGDGTNLSPHW